VQQLNRRRRRRRYAWMIVTTRSGYGEAETRPDTGAAWKNRVTHCRG
jgi:hypothetical protein